MQSEKLDDLRMGIAGEFRRGFGTLGEVAEHFAHRQVEKMVDKGQVLELTEEEERMLRAYRGFCARGSGGVFSWQAPAPIGIITELPEPVLLRDPREVSVE